MQPAVAHDDLTGGRLAGDRILQDLLGDVGHEKDVLSGLNLSLLGDGRKRTTARAQGDAQLALLVTMCQRVDHQSGGIAGHQGRVTRHADLSGLFDIQTDKGDIPSA